VTRPTPAAFAISLVLAPGSRLRHSVAASTIAAMLRCASARLVVVPAAFAGIETPLVEHHCSSYGSADNPNKGVRDNHS
jgi:hypothetical protein